MRLFAAAAALLFLACNTAPLEPIAQMQEAGVLVGQPLDKPCLGWCRVSGNLRGLGNPEGIPFAFEATTPISAPWASILSQSSSKWGSPTAVYRIDRDVETPGPSERWRATTAATHRRYLGDAASVLRLGDHSGPTDYAVFQGGDTLIRISRTNTNVRAIYMNRSFAGTPLSF